MKRTQYVSVQLGCVLLLMSCFAYTTSQLVINIKNQVISLVYLLLLLQLFS